MRFYWKYLLLPRNLPLRRPSTPFLSAFSVSRSIRNVSASERARFRCSNARLNELFRSSYFCLSVKNSCVIRFFSFCSVSNFVLISVSFKSFSSNRLQFSDEFKTIMNEIWQIFATNIHKLSTENVQTFEIFIGTRLLSSQQCKLII